MGPRTSRLLLTAEQARELDIRAKERLGMPVLLLMENAGRSVAEESINILRGRKKVAVFCGKGNNGADGFVAARHLLTKGVRPDIFFAGDISQVKDEARINLGILRKLKQKVFAVNEENLSLVKDRIAAYALIIDALLGTGLKGQIEGTLKRLIEIINRSPAHILSIDIPSGLDATTAKALGCCIRADTTVTFVAKKRAMALEAGRKYCGEIIVKDLGIKIGS